MKQNIPAFSSITRYVVVKSRHSLLSIGYCSTQKRIYTFHFLFPFCSFLSFSFPPQFAFPLSSFPFLLILHFPSFDSPKRGTQPNNSSIPCIGHTMVPSAFLFHFLFFFSLLISFSFSDSDSDSDSNSVGPTFHRVFPRPLIVEYPEFEAGLRCGAWRVAGEANNLGAWRTIPEECTEYVKEYMTGKGYAVDLEMVSKEAEEFARSVPLGGDGKDAWIFDIDETLLSNLPYYAAHGYGYSHKKKIIVFCFVTLFWIMMTLLGTIHLTLVRNIQC